MKKYRLSIVYNEITDEVEEIEETISDMESIPKILSIGPNSLIEHLTTDEYYQLNNSYNGEIIHA